MISKHTSSWLAFAIVQPLLISPGENVSFPRSLFSSSLSWEIAGQISCPAENRTTIRTNQRHRQTPATWMLPEPRWMATWTLSLTTTILWTMTIDFHLNWRRCTIQARPWNQGLLYRWATTNAGHQRQTGMSKLALLGKTIAKLCSTGEY